MGYGAMGQGAIGMGRDGTARRRAHVDECGAVEGDEDVDGLQPLELLGQRRARAMTIYRRLPMAY